VFLPDTHVTRFVGPLVFSSKKINFKHGNSTVMVQLYGCIINNKRKTVYSNLEHKCVIPSACIVCFLVPDILFIPDINLSTHGGEEECV
jgi:hypothetical protein